MELVLQKATELGVAEIWPVVTDRTDAAARPALHGTRVERWERVASGAAEQCGRAVVPPVADTSTLGALLAQPFDGTRIALLETPGRSCAANRRARGGQAAAAPDRAGRRLRAVGVRPAPGADFQAASIGPRILRSETAAVAAVAIAQAVWGDLR